MWRDINFSSGKKALCSITFTKNCRWMSIHQKSDSRRKFSVYIMSPFLVGGSWCVRHLVLLLLLLLFEGNALQVPLRSSERGRGGSGGTKVLCRHPSIPAGSHWILNSRCGTTHRLLSGHAAEASMPFKSKRYKPECPRFCPLSACHVTLRLARLAFCAHFFRRAHWTQMDTNGRKWTYVNGPIW